VRGTANVALRGDAAAFAAGQNCGVSGSTPESVDRAWLAVARAAELAVRTWRSPNGPVLLAVGLGLAALLELSARTETVSTGAVANLLAIAPLALARRHLAWAAQVVVLGVCLSLADPDSTLTVSAFVVLVVVAFQVAARYRRRWSVLLAVPFLLNAVVPFSESHGAVSGVLVLALVVAAQVLGDARAQRGEALAERDVALRDQAALEERARIARELHDIVAHHVSGIAVQAETARLTTPGLPDEGARRLEAIGDTARDALAEMRRLVGVLRENGDAEREPQPGLDRLDELIAAAWASGTYVRLTVAGEAVPLPPGLDLTAYRIVQEALTNTRRHAPGANVDVEVRWDAGALSLRVRDNGPGPGDGVEEGHGLVGMRERAAMVGGSLYAGAAEGGGFVVEAELPLPERGA
jgi:signal transduction histidine kinase